MDWTTYRNRILAEIDNEAFFLGELQDVQRRGNEIKASCPFAASRHANGLDENPSFTVNLQKGTYYCNSCGSKGNVQVFYRELYGLSSEQAWLDLGDALKIERPNSSKPARPDIEPGLATEYHSTLMGLTGPIRTMLRERRGLTDDTVRRFQLGWDGQRLTIPIYDEFNTLVNFRLYKWNSTDDAWKVINYEDEHGNRYGEVRLYGIENLLDESVEEVVYCEGELDRICAEQHGFAAVSATSGAGSWKPEWTKYFRGKKKVYIVQDNDDAGRRAAAKLCDKLYRVVDCYVVQWPEDFPNKGDVTDWFTKCGLNEEDFQNMLNNAVKYVDPHGNDDEILADESEAVEVHLAESGSAKYASKRIKVPVMVSGKDTTPYVLPKTVKAICGEAAGEGGKKCLSCSLALNAGEFVKTFNAADAKTLQLIKCTEAGQLNAICNAMGVNQRCNEVRLEVVDKQNLEEIRLIPKAEANFGFAKEHEYVVRTGYYAGSDLKANKRYTLVGYMHPDPKEQFATYIYDKAYPEKDLISEFEMTPEIFEQLKVFQVEPTKTIEDKFNEIHEDLERNVTYIWQRRDVAFAVDLIYHTVLNFYFQGQFVKRGWGELLIIGDSGQAKTTIVERLMAHYKLGELHSGESSKRTGLVYNLQQTNKRWFLTWGAFPLNDGGLVTIDELSGLSEDDLAVMSDVRSSGIAKVSGVITSETSSRTRAIYISNPRNGRPLNTETYGVNAVLKLMGKAEDVRRLDMAMSVASGDVDPRLINRSISSLPAVKHQYTSELCNLRVMWAWSRRPDDIVISEEAAQRILDKATEMGSKYSSKVPIVEAADQRIKIARLSIAAACCTFSTDDGKKVIVRPEHVDFVVDFMNRLYCTKSFGYDKLSEQEQIRTDTTDENISKLRARFLSLSIGDHNEMASVLYQLPYFSRSTLEDYSGLPREDLRLLLKFLTINNLVDKSHGDYRRLPLGTKLFENLATIKATKEEVDKARREAYAGSEF